MFLLTNRYSSNNDWCYEKNLFFSYADSNIIYPISDIEAMFHADTIELRAVQGVSFDIGRGEIVE